MKDIKKIVILVSLTTLFSCRSAFIPTTAMEHTPQTKSLYKNLKKQAKKGYMFGQHDATSYGIGWRGENDRSDVKSVVGDYPAVISFDIGHIEHGHPYSLDKVSFENMRTQILNHYKRGGVVSISWHLDNPLTGGDSWDISSNKVVASILPNGENAEKFKGWLHQVADFLNSLKTDEGEKIPVIFRPWHEHSGSWFWWGQNLCTTEEYKSLWRLTEKILREKEVDNVLLAYSPGGDATDYMERYPGDDIIDILGFDFYQYDKNPEKYIQTFQNTLSFLREYSKKTGKIYAVTETGYESIPDPTWWTDTLDKAIGKYKPAYVLVWRNADDRPNHFYAPHPGHLSVDNFLEFYNSKRVFFLKEIRNMYQIKKDLKK